MLTRTLRNLESSGLIARRVTTSKSIAVEYSLTKPGRTFIALVDKNLPLGQIITTRNLVLLCTVARRTTGALSLCNCSRCKGRQGKEAIQIFREYQVGRHGEADCLAAVSIRST